ncbi:MAG: tail fiber domain-containing protein [Candidatus Udaeobacter sp.]
MKNNTGNRNTADGYRALFKNTGSDNTAVGFEALEQNTSAINNVAIGSEALGDDMTGFQNVAVGAGALEQATTGSRNIGIGFLAGESVVAGNDNIYIGNIGGGRRGGIDFSGSIRIGTQGIQNLTRIAGIFGAALFNGTPVYIDSSGQLGTTPSSVRFKEEIAPMNKASETLYALKPVTFRYRNEIDPTGTRQLGLVAEDVEKINPDLVVRDADGKPYSVRYDQVNAMLLNEFLKEHRTVQGQQKEIDALKAELREQKTLIQKVSAQFEASKPAPQVVNSP